MNGEGIYRALGAAVAKRRKALGMTQIDLACRIGISRASLASIETGRQGVLLHQVYEIANALGLESIQELAADRTQAESLVPLLPIDANQITTVQRSQVERVIHLALTRGESFERRSS